tara:strand:- start:550 stop:897 length:348 start_codon:yes stop_codon:yes gene_type:complete
MSNYINWKGIAEDGNNGDFKWGTNTYKWSDVQLITEVAEVVGGGGKSRLQRQRDLDKWLDKEPDKKKRLIKLVATIDGQKYTQTKEVEEVKVEVEDVEILIKEIFSRLIVEKKDV